MANALAMSICLRRGCEEKQLHRCSPARVYCPRTSTQKSPVAFEPTNSRLLRGCYARRYAVRPFRRPLPPQLAPGRGTAREVLRVKSSSARPHHAERRWGRTTSLRSPGGGGGPA